VTWLSAALLGVVQGLTEFLPVSSSAHLVLARALLGWNVEESTFGLAFDVALHVGTLLAILAFFRREIGEILMAAPNAMSATQGPGKVARAVVIGTIPIVVLGAAAGGWLEEHARTPPVIAVTLIVGALWMMLAEWQGSQDRTEESLTSAGAAVVGVAQATAIVPGMSRSGSTISMAMLLGLTRESAARFSFLLGVPAIAGAAAKEGLHMLRHGGFGAHDVALFALGMGISAVVGYLTIRFFLKYLAGHSLNVFAYYRLALAAVTIYWLYGR